MKSKEFDLDFTRRERYTYTKIFSSQGKVPGKSFGGSNTMSVALNTKHLFVDKAGEVLCIQNDAHSIRTSKRFCGPFALRGYFLV